MKNLKNLTNFIDLIFSLKKDPLELLKRKLEGEVNDTDPEWEKGQVQVLSKILPLLMESEVVTDSVKQEATQLLAEIARNL